MSKQQQKPRSSQEGKKGTSEGVSIKDWLIKGLTECLQFEPPVEVASHVMLAETEEALVDFLENLLDMKSSTCQRFVSDVVRLRNLPREKPSQGPLTVPQPSKPEQVQQKSPTPAKSQHQVPHAKAISLKEAGQLDRVLLPGRRQCQCLATKHALVGNCVKCGRIICQQEGPGPCLFCSNPVGDADAKAPATLKDTFIAPPQQDDALSAALEHRDKLLEYDKTSAQRTRIYDDQADFFQTGSAWLNEGERKALIEKQAKLYDQRFGPRRHKTVALDFAGRQIVEVAPKESAFDEGDEAGGSSTTFSRPPGFGNQQQLEASNSSYLVNPVTLADSDYPKPYYVATETGGGSGKSKQRSDQDENGDFTVKPGRLQDNQLLEMTDRGVCLSVQQPYASLIVLGIKRFEGRTWATSHRGRLWIVSSAKPCSQEMVSSIEKFYKALYSDDKLAFPRTYPSGVLLGCVDVVDCLPQEQFRERFPDGECEDLFVWVLANPKLLSIQFPITGQKPNLYRLSGHVHRAASRALITS